MFVLTNSGKILSTGGSLPMSMQSEGNRPLALAEAAVNKQRDVVRKMGDNTPVAKMFLRKLEEKLEELAQDDLMQQAGFAGIA